MQRRAEDLLQRLQQGLPVTVTVYGDSLTAGMGTDGRHTLARLFIDYLRYRFPDCEIEAHVAGNPGWTTEDALRGFNRQVLPTDPDLLIVQFGGNDRGWGGTPGQFRTGLTRLLERASNESDALVIACLPPFAEEIGDSPWTIVAREVAAASGAPAADFHQAIREGPHDFRGSFPYGGHPGSFTHMLMAKEIVRVFDDTLGTAPVVSVEIVRQATVSSAAEETVSVTVSTLSEAAAEWSMWMEFGRDSRQLQGTVSREAPVTISETFAIREDLPAGRSYSIPVRTWLRSGNAADFDLAWLTVAPAIVASPEPEQWHHLGADELVLGRQHWQGEEDLSARFRVGRSEDHLTIEVQVTDDMISVADLRDPSRGDSVEIYLDLRSPEGQGRPIYTEDVLALQILAPHDDAEAALWRNMHDLPADLADIDVAVEPSDSGYRVAVALPLAAVEARRGEDWGGLGLDVGVNDADLGDRKQQMMWRGIAENYLNPAYLAGVYAEMLPEGATRRILK